MPWKQIATMTSQTAGKLLLSLCLVFLLASAIFLAFPGLDLRASSFFHTQDNGFWLRDNAVLHAYRDVFNAMSIGLAAISAVLWAWSAFRGPLFGISFRVWAFISLLYLLGPGLVVNGILKAHWGRARPANVSEFGGDRTFTRVLELSDQCERNCSFVSGEGSSAAAFFISLLVLSAYIPGRRARYIVLSCGFVFALLAATLRVIKGRHFVSDTLFAAIFVSLVALLLARLLLMNEAQSNKAGSAENTTLS